MFTEMQLHAHEEWGIEEDRIPCLLMLGIHGLHYAHVVLSSFQFLCTTDL